jgi:hypothetical protein
VKRRKTAEITIIMKQFLEITAICPYCRCHLQGIKHDTTIMNCWHCNKEIIVKIPEEEIKNVPIR